MSETACWRLHDELSIKQATCLMLGLLPRDKYTYIDSVFYTDDAYRHEINAVGSAMINAVIGGRLPARIRLKNSSEKIQDSDQISHRDIDWDTTTVIVEDLRSWLKGRGITTGFFSLEDKNSLDYLFRNHEHFAPKLAAAVRVWQAVSSDPKLYSGTSIKKAMEKWLHDNANELGLIKEDGTPNKQGIEEIAKVSNWQDKGGAPKTPG